jgi:hypothetical protein
MNWLRARRHGVQPVGVVVDEVTLAIRVATCQLNARARLWVWGRRAPSPRYRRRVLTYCT